MTTGKRFTTVATSRYFALGAVDTKLTSPYGERQSRRVRRV